MKLILIEDEPDSLEGMRRAVESIRDMDFALFTANQAEEALQIVESERPDLIVTDIMLPGKTGLDLVEEAVHGGYQPTVIVVSGYNDFEYARRSIRLGAVDYLLKPYETDEFVEKIRKSLFRIGERKTRDLELRRQQSFAEIGTRWVRDEHLVELCLKPSRLEEHLYHRLRLWDLEWLADRSYTVFVLDTKGFPDGKPPGQSHALQTFAIGNIVNDCAQAYPPSILFKDPKHRWVFITAVDGVNAHAIADRLAASVAQFHKVDVAVGKSAVKTKFQQLHEAYQEALAAFRISSLMSDPEACAETGDPGRLPEAWSAEHLSSSIVHGDQETIRRGVRVFLLDTLRKEGTESREDMTRGVLNLISEVHLEIRRSVSKELEEIPIRVWESLDACRTLEDYEDVLGGYFSGLVKECQTPKTNAIVERAVRIIDERFAEENLSLAVLAEALCIHPVWLSQTFKKETGRTYLDYLTEVRIDRAKTLLRETSLKIYEIAEKVGYRDLQYFGLLFKKRTGLTPKEYRYGK
ncbi:response regulator [Cohnella caldifontis]|uniref:response regulator n=1 Tax=Cohnella caldifontis TaxID=3027471 RepID=UPI0023EB58B3|nr:response regulator [Cohnella sp. YIM B05605]